MAKKRGNGEGSFQKLRSGVWRGQLMDGFLPNGKRNIVTFLGATKGEAQDKMREFINAKKEGRLLNGGPVPFNVMSDLWYEDYKTQVQPSTYDNYRYTLNTLKSHFGSTPVEEILQIHVNRFLTELQEKGYSHSKINKCKAMLIQIFTFAEDNGKVLKNPAIRAKTLRDLSGETKKKDAFKEGEVALLMDLLPDTLLGNSIRVLLISGLRVQELLALTQEDLAEDGSWIRVNKAIKMVKGSPVMGPPKSKTSNRTVPIPEDYRDLVKRLREQGGRGMLWCSKREDQLYSIKWFRAQYYRAIKGIKGVRSLPPHCCRHTYVTRLEAENVPLQLIAHLVGHSSVETTVRYTHTEPETLMRAVTVLNRQKAVSETGYPAGSIPRLPASGM